MALLTATSPSDWKALQEEVAAILDECGFTVERERVFETVRGSVELDVYAEETVNGRTYSIACECKHWQSRVPQTVIHAFRTVVADLGVNVGYIISSNGFQSGAFSASELTNLKLLTWEKFQEEFCNTWLENHLSPTITNQLDPIIACTDILVPTWFTKVPDHEIPVLRSLREKYTPFGILMMTFTRYARFLRTDGFPDLPLRHSIKDPFSNPDKIPDAIMDATGYRDLLGHVMEYGKTAIAEFFTVKERNNV